jgi:alginate O-acetyltransferase complex protein AlgI
MSWDYRFGALIFVSTIVDYILAIYIEKTEVQSKRFNLLQISLILNLVAILGFFKYYNFASDNVNSLFILFGFEKALPELKIILPVGVSFFTFQSMSYTIDVYRKEIEVEKSFIRFALFVSFFPQLVAGPIVTAKTFLPQLYKDSEFEEIPFLKAIRYFFLGYIKKVIISDNISPIVDLVYSNPESYGSSATWLASILFIAQIYCDFSGYTDMAYSSALLLGYELPENFRLPLICRSFTDFWRRWHISLSSWLKEYLYFSLGGSKVGYFRHKLNLVLTMLIAGLWHGASWNFVLWGGLQGVIMAVENAYSGYVVNKYGKEFANKKIPILRYVIQNISTLLFFTFIGTLFRTGDMKTELLILKNFMNFSDMGLRPYMVKIGFSAIVALIVGNVIGIYIYERNVKLMIPKYVEFIFYIFSSLFISLLTNDNLTPFIYFQF